MSDRLDAVVLGAGVVGLAVARSLALAGREVVVLEKEPEIGMHTSSRNSEVIHAGLYYPEDSLKATLCVRGKQMLYRYAEERGIPHQRIGKLIVATCAEEVSGLEAIAEQASKNGVLDLQWVDRERLREMEPALEAHAGLYSPSTGIVDSHSLMLTMQADIEAQGGTVLTHSQVQRVRATPGGFRLALDDVDEDILCRTFVNAAGLWATDIAAGIAPSDDKRTARAQFAIGHYFAYQGRSPFRHLVYPVPVDGGLGVHATNDMGGSARFGPDVEWVETIDYAFDDSRKQRFVDAISRYYPDLDASRLVPAYTGIRPKLSGPGEAPRDFLIEGEGGHGVPGLVNLFGIESPGLTASLAIGDHVKALLD